MLWLVVVGKHKSSTNTCQVSVDAENYTNYADSLLLFDNFSPARSSSSITRITQGTRVTLRCNFCQAASKYSIRWNSHLSMSFVGQWTINIWLLKRSNVALSVWMCALMPLEDYSEIGAIKHRANAALGGHQYLVLSMSRCHFSLLPSITEASKTDIPKWQMGWLVLLTAHIHLHSFLAERKMFTI